MSIGTALAVLALGYLLGSFPSGYLAGRLLRGIDIREWGSGATGGTNVYRTLGAGPAIATGLTDLLKGTAAAFIGQQLGGDWGYFLGGMAAVVGHSYPVWLQFRGGKSVATGAGTFLAHHPLAFLIALTAGVAVIWRTRYVSLGSLVAGVVLLVTMLVRGAALPHLLMAFLAVSVIFIRHWENMKRLAAGTENKFGQKAQPVAERPALQKSGT